MKKAMLITVGTGKGGDVADGIAASVVGANPSYVVFIGTGMSLKDTLPLVLEKTGLDEKQYITRTTANQDDVDRSVAEYVVYIREILGKGYGPDEIVVDFTSGTKAMSAALVVAALAEDVGSMSYVCGERGDGGRVISGTERVQTLRANLMLVDGKLRRAVDLFNTFQYAGCLGILADLRKRTQKPEVLDRIGLLSGLAEAYRAWDRFDHRTAMTRLDELTRHRLLPAWGHKKKVEGHKAFLHRLQESGDYSIERAVDLRNNAGRRAEEGKFDDAVARLYRLLEYIGQVKLHRDQGGLVTESLDLSKLPESLREKYAEKRGHSGKVQPSLVSSYELLGDLDDPVGIQFMDAFRAKGSEIKDVLGQRNKSILAHGFGPVGESVYGPSAALVDRYLDAAFEGWRERAKEATFPVVGNI